MWRAENIALISPQLWTFSDKMENNNITLYVCSCLCPKGSSVINQLFISKSIFTQLQITAIRYQSGIQNLLEQKIIQGHWCHMQTPVFTVYVQATLKVNNLITLRVDLKSKWHQKGNKHGAFPGMVEDGRGIQHFQSSQFFI